MEHKWLRRPMKAALGLLYPPQCLGCGNPVAASGAQLCPDCWREARFISSSACNRCGAPLPDDGRGIHDDDAICDDCMAIARPWQQGRAAFVYSGTGRRLILSLKHSDRPDLAPHLAEWLSRAAAPLLRPGQIIAPVPLHLRRLIKRRYNQAALLAACVAKTDAAQAKGAQYLPDLLVRRRHTAGQDHRGVAERFANLSEAIGVNPRRSADLRDKPVLLIDDIMTSGATLAAATEALLAAGAGPVSVAVLARAVKDD